MFNEKTGMEMYGPVISQWDRFKLLFKPTIISVDFSHEEDSGCTIYWKEMDGKMVVVGQKIHSIKTEKDTVER